MLRKLILVLLGLGVAGFGLCSLCGGAFTVAVLSDAKSFSGAESALYFTLFIAIGAGLLAWLCYRGFLFLLRGRAPTPPSSTPE